MERHIVTTSDGSHSLYVPALDEHFHSRHGAIQESMHVFIRMGWEAVAAHRNKIRVLEIGLGTGLNAFLTLLKSKDEGKQVNYSSVEAFPLLEQEYSILNFAEELLRTEERGMLGAIHTSVWDEPVALTPTFILHKILGNIEDFTLPERVDLIYFDAFAPDKQPELWTKAVFDRMYACLENGGLLVTYCCKGDVKRAMKAAGFVIKKAPGPPGKREMLQAWKK